MYSSHFSTSGSMMSSSTVTKSSNCGSGRRAHACSTGIPWRAVGRQHSTHTKPRVWLAGWALPHDDAQNAQLEDAVADLLLLRPLPRQALRHVRAHRLYTGHGQDAGQVGHASVCWRSRALPPGLVPLPCRLRTGNRQGGSGRERVRGRGPSPWRPGPSRRTTA